MIIDQPKPTTIFEAVADTFDLNGFLSCALTYGIEVLNCDAGSVYLVDGATETLQHRYHSERGPVRVILKFDEGVAGKGLRLRNPHVFSGNELKRSFEDWGRTGKCDQLRAILTVPVYYRNIPQAVFCFDFKKNSDTYLEDPLSASEKDGVEKLSSEIEDLRFANAINRIRIHEAQIDIRAAGNGPARLRQAVAEYLTNLLAALATAKVPAPKIAYLQLVDRRRSSIRTIQGVGMPLVFQTLLSHLLDSNDVQAHLVRDCRPLIIVGKDPLMDPVIFERFEHHRLVRLWLPLFPFPMARLVQRPLKKIEELFEDLLQWEETENHDANWRRAAAIWDEHSRVHPPSRLVFGTLELGYEREDMASLSFEPLTPKLASWLAAKSYELSEELFKFTLSGSLDRIAKTLANQVWPYKTRLIVAMPNWHSPEVRSFPTTADWPAAIPAASGMISPPPGVPAKFEFSQVDGNPQLAVDKSRGELLERLKSHAQEAVRVALRLDDHVADLYTLIEKEDSQGYFGTEYPDLKLGEILAEICRESAADRCVHFLFEKENPLPLDTKAANDSHLGWMLLGKPQPWPLLDPLLEPTEVEYELSKRVAKSRVPTYETLSIDGLRLPVAALPLELSEQTQAVILLYFSKESIVIEDEIQLDLEGRISRWVYKLSLRNLLIADRFSRLMGVGGLRSDLAEARIDASSKEPGTHLRAFVEKFLSQSVLTMKAFASLLVFYSESETAPPTVDRFWCCRNDFGVERVDSHSFVGEIKDSPARKATKTKALIIYPPNAPNRLTEIAEVNKELMARVKELESDKEFDRALKLRSIVNIANNQGGPSTLVVIPIIGRASHDQLIRGAITYILPGEHYLSQNQQGLMLEIGRLVAETVGRMRGLDSIGFEKSFSDRLDDLRIKLANSATHDDAIGHFLWGIGRRLPTSTADPTDTEKKWMLADHAVVWLLTPGYRELVARSGLGMGLDAVEKFAVMNPHDHPLVSKTFPVQTPKKDHPSISDFIVQTFAISNNSNNELLRRYALLSNCNWMVSFPLMQADSRAIGVVDCLREIPLRPDEEAALPNMLRRLSQQLCFALERCRFGRAIEVDHELTDEVGKEINAFHAASVYRILVERVRDELGVAHCDLFLDRDDTMILHGSTRLRDAIPEKKRMSYYVKPKVGEEIIGNAYATRTTRIFHASSGKPAMDHLSPELSILMAEDHSHERLVVTLGRRENESEPLPGILYLRGPLSKMNQGQAKKIVKKSGIITFEHLRRAQDLSVVVYKNAMMARIVERKGWLIGELQHQLGQPLQILRGWCEDRLRDLAGYGMDENKLLKIGKSLRRGFGLVHEGRNNLATYAKISQPLDVAEMSEVKLKRVISECCGFMQPEADRKSCLILYSFPYLKPIWGNPALLRSAILNLLDNAIKYSYEGREIAVDIREDASGTIQLVVENYGVGIPHSDLNRVFQPYFRSKVPDEKGARSGSGIGLAIVWHAIVVGHAGQVSVESIPPRKIRDLSPTLSAAETAKYPHKTTFTLILERKTLDEMRRKSTNV